jgi:uncharacterized BrkB/YihY/UPF0761 family membrane protein
MINKNLLQPILRVICGILCFLELIVLGYINYFYAENYIGCTMTPISFLASICESGAFIIFILFCLDVFWCYKTLFSEKNKIWHAPLLVVFLASQIILILNISTANI